MTFYFFKNIIYFKRAFLKEQKKSERHQRSAKRQGSSEGNSDTIKVKFSVRIKLTCKRALSDFF